MEVQEPAHPSATPVHQPTAPSAAPSKIDPRWVSSCRAQTGMHKWMNCDPVADFGSSAARFSRGVVWCYQCSVPGCTKRRTRGPGNRHKMCKQHDLERSNNIKAASEQRAINSECKKRKRIDGDRDEREEGSPPAPKRIKNNSVSLQRAGQRRHRDSARHGISLAGYSHLASCPYPALSIAETLQEVHAAPSFLVYQGWPSSSRRVPGSTTRRLSNQLGQLVRLRLNLIRLDPTSSQTSTNDSADDAFWSAHAHINTDGFHCQYTIDIPF